MKTRKQDAKASGHTASDPKQKNGAKTQDKSMWQADSSKHRPIGFRVHDEAEEHFPTSTFVLSDESTCREWAAAMRQTDIHAECTWRIEQLFLDQTTSHVLSRIGELPDEPLLGPIAWTDSELPFDLGPITQQVALDQLVKVKTGSGTALLESAALAATEEAQGPKAPAKGDGEKGKAETKANGDTAKNGGKTDKKPNDKPEAGAPDPGPIGSSHPVPKPGQSAQGGSSKAALVMAKRSHSHALRAKPATKHTKRT